MAELRLINDVLFKLVFGEKESEPVLRALLNALLGYKGEEKIVSLTIQNPGLSKEFVSDKGSTLDLKAVDRRGQWYNIEVQLQDNDGCESYLKRTLYYWARLYSEQIVVGQQYIDLKKTISISLLDFVIFPDSPNLHSTYVLLEKETHDPFPSILELHYIELQKFSPEKPHHLRTPFEKWLYILRFSELYSEHGTTLPDNLREEEGIYMAIETYQKAIARDEVQEMIRARRKARMDYESGMASARARGHAEGLGQGLEQGRAEERIKTEQEAKRAEEEAKRAEQEAKRAEEEAKRAEEEARRAEEQARRAERLEQELRELKARLEKD